MYDEKLAKTEKELKELLSVDNPFGCGHAKRFIWRDPAGITACAACWMFAAERLEQSTIPRATVAAALAALRTEWQHQLDYYTTQNAEEIFFERQCELEIRLRELNVTIVALGLNPTATNLCRCSTIRSCGN